MFIKIRLQGLIPWGNLLAGLLLGLEDLGYSKSEVFLVWLAIQNSL
jgi:hypothetical protein